MRLVHISDLHFGPLYDAEVGERLLFSIAGLKAKSLVVSGDMTQRATRSQFIAAAEWLKRASQVVENIVICPGNHDIPMFRVWERVVQPFHLYQEYIHPELDQIFYGDDVTIVSLNSVRPWSRLVQGKLSRKQFLMTAQGFAKSDEDKVHILMFHHPLISFQKQYHHPGLDVRWQDISRGERVDLVLTGHLHDADVQLMHDEATGRPMLMVSCGTSASRRGRGKDAGRNSFNVIDGSRSNVAVQTYYYNTESKAFALSEEASFDLTKNISVANILPTYHGVGSESEAKN